MFLKRMTIALLAAVFVIGLAILKPGAHVAATQQGPMTARMCLACHATEPGNILGNYESVAFKSESMQVRIDDRNQILTFNPETLKVVIRGKTEPAEALRNISRGHEIRVQFAQQDVRMIATAVTAKPPISVPAEKLITTQEVMKLVAMGPEKGNYFLVDSRPAARFFEGAIPTAVNIPDAALPARADLLPVDKDILLIFYCGGVT